MGWAYRGARATCLEGSGEEPWTRQSWNSLRTQDNFDGKREGRVQLGTGSSIKQRFGGKISCVEESVCIV